MNDSAISFGNLGPAEVALVCAAALLLFRATDLAVLNAHDATRRAIARRGYLLSVLGGLGFGLAVSALAVPARLRAPLLVAAGIAATLIALGWPRFPAMRRIRWDLGMASVSLLSCGITIDFMAWFWTA